MSKNEAVKEEISLIQTGDTCCAVIPEDGNMMSYWDEVFEGKDLQNWSEKDEPKIMEWIRASELNKSANIFCAGIGDSTLVDHLLAEGFANIVVNDISEVALEKIRNRVGSNVGVTFIQDDLMKPTTIKYFYGKIDLYIDRATLHFFTACKDKDFYFSQLKNLLTPKGQSILSVFSKNNEPKCCGLDLQLWSLESLKNQLSDYKVIAEKTENFTEQNGKKREYISINVQANI